MADFPYSPDNGYTVTSGYNVSTIKFENQAEQSRLKSSKKLRVFDLSFTTRTKAEFDAVVAFFDSVKEDLTSFTIAIDGETVTGKFQKDSFQHKRVAFEIYNYNFTFREIV